MSRKISDCRICIYYDGINDLCCNGRTCLDGTDSNTRTHDTLNHKTIESLYPEGTVEIRRVEIVDKETDFSRMCKRIRNKYRNK